MNKTIMIVGLGLSLSAGLTSAQSYTGADFNASIDGTSTSPQGTVTQHTLINNQTFTASFGTSNVGSAWQGSYSVNTKINSFPVSSANKAVYEYADLTNPVTYGSRTINNIGYVGVFGSGVAGQSVDYTITYDFTNLANGYLPAGSLIYIQDFDVTGENLNVSAVFNSGSNGLWLGSPETDASSGYLAPTVTFDNGSNSYSVSSRNNSGAGSSSYDINSYITTRDINSIEMNAKQGSGNTAYYAGILAPVPEPSSTVLLGLGTLGLVLRRRR